MTQECLVAAEPPGLTAWKPEGGRGLGTDTERRMPRGQRIREQEQKRQAPSDPSPDLVTEVPKRGEKARQDTECSMGKSPTLVAVVRKRG